MATGKYQKWIEPEGQTLIQGWRRDGLSDDQVAKNMGISRSTLHAWIAKHKAISDAYKKGSEVAVYEVENALYKSAIGYFVTETEQTESEYPDGTILKVKKAKKRYIPPSTGAQCFILKNKAMSKWKDKPDLIELTEETVDKFAEALKATESEDIWKDEEDNPGI